MCELFAMSALYPTEVRLSLEELARHGGGTGPHRDGWGVAFMQERDAFIVREPGAAHESACLAFLREQRIRADMVIAHIRRATQGARKLRNSQPFTRELGGFAHVFAHNGMVHGIERDARFTSRRFRPVGDTDSEQAFCGLLDRMASHWERGVPSLETRLGEIASYARQLRQLGPANFIYCDGDATFAHAHLRRQDHGDIAPPGLHVLCRRCHSDAGVVPLAGVSLPPHDDQHVALLASVPLSNERWEPLHEGEIVVLRSGRVVERVLADAA
jgi:predicted glutamine amidotransferase